MKSHLFIAAAAAVLTLAACGQGETKVEEPAAPVSLMEQVQAMPEENQPVFAVGQLQAYQRAHPESVPVCVNTRDAGARGVIPADVAPDTIYAQHIGSLVFSIQCGELRTRARFDPQEHWLVVFAPGAQESTIVHCANEEGRDVCPTVIPRMQAPAAPATTPAPATP